VELANENIEIETQEVEPDEGLQQNEETVHPIVHSPQRNEVVIRHSTRNHRKPTYLAPLVNH
jgi:ribosomal protein S12